jgi:hypothetical protein
MSKLDRFYVHTASVETFTGAGPRGDTFATAVNVACFVDDAQDVVVTGATLAVNDQTKIYAPLSTVATFAVNSRVTVNGVTALVRNVKRRSSGALNLPDHVEVSIR